MKLSLRFSLRCFNRIILPYLSSGSKAVYIDFTVTDFPVFGDPISTVISPGSILMFFIGPIWLIRILLLVILDHLGKEV